MSTDNTQQLDEEFGVTGTCHQWIHGYLTGRSFTVRVGQSTSSTILMTTGVPQVSVLGPILYMAYVGPVSRLTANHEVQRHQYADDNQIFNSMTADAIDSLQACVNSLQHWFWANGLLLNPNICSTAYFVTERRLQNIAPSSMITVTGSNVDIMGSLHILESPWTADFHWSNMSTTR